MKKKKNQISYVMVSATGEVFIVESFGFWWVFQGLHGLGYWSDPKKLINFYEKSFGFTCLGEL